MNQDFVIIAFSSTHQAIHFEKKLISIFAIEMIPTPREVSASCGLSLKFETDDLAAILVELADEDKTGLQLIKVINNPSGRQTMPLDWR